MYLDHIVDSSKDHEVSVRELPSHVSGVVDASPEGFFIFLREIPVSPEVRVFKAYLTDHSGRYPIAVLIQDQKLSARAPGYADRRAVISPVCFKDGSQIAGLRLGVCVIDRHIFPVNILQGFAGNDQCAQFRMKYRIKLQVGWCEKCRGNPVFGHARKELCRILGH